MRGGKKQEKTLPLKLVVCRQGAGDICADSITNRLGFPSHALLAQSAERFHGKEKVVGSIPTEGSAIWRCPGHCAAQKCVAQNLCAKKMVIGSVLTMAA